MLEFNPETHEYKWDGKLVPCVSNIIAPLRDFSGIPAGVLETKRQWGEMVHLYTSMFDNGTLDADHTKWDERMVPIVAAWDRFKEQFGLDKYVFIEKPLYSEKYRFAGTPDRVYDNFIVDIKTAANSQKSTGVQLAAYAHLCGMENTARLVEVRLLDDGNYKV
ncbi:MAG: hypothetical protein PHC68_16125, partial [Syntrophorhabdaceae bacterium]|nr:hypothetical protein [Syntrophorhabdaceae bacterium]